MEVQIDDDSLVLISEDEVIFKSENKREKKLLSIINNLLINKGKIVVCSIEKKNSTARAFREIPKIVEEIKKDQDVEKYFNQIAQILISKFPPGQEFYQEQVRKILSDIDPAWKNTFGDKVRTYLGLLTCQGICRIKKFNLHKPGHQYEVCIKQEKCPYWNDKSMECTNRKKKLLKSGDLKVLKKFKRYSYI